MPDPPSCASASASRFDTREQLALGAIVLAGFALRLLHLHEIRANDPFFEIPAVDGQMYHAQAQAIAKGDFGEGVVILGPFYPWFMALVYKLAGPSLFVLKNLQAAIGALDCVLVAMLARLHFERGAVALLSAGFAAFYGMLVFYGGTVMIVNVMVPLVLGSAIAVTHALREPTLSRWFVAGLLVSGGILARQNMMLFALLVGGWILYDLRERLDGAARARMVAAFAAGVFVLILPFTARNAIVGGDLILLNSTGGISLYMGNNARANGAWVQPRFGMRVDSPLAMQRAFKVVAERETGRPMKPSELSSFWSGKARSYALENPGDWLALELRKLLLFWNAREVWNNRSIDISRDFSWVLRLPLVGYGLIAPLGLVGMGLAWRRWRELFPLYALVAVHLASGLIIFVLSRYRVPAVPILMIFAAFTVVQAVEWVRDKSWKPLGLAVGWLAVAAIVVHRDAGQEDLHMAHFNVGNKYRDLARYEEAIESYQASLAINPGFVSTHNNLALAYEGAGRRQEAIESWRWVLEAARSRGDGVRVERAERHLRELGAVEAPEGE